MWAAGVRLAPRVAGVIWRSDNLAGLETIGGVARASIFKLLDDLRIRAHHSEARHSNFPQRLSPPARFPVMFPAACRNSSGARDLQNSSPRPLGQQQERVDSPCHAMLIDHKWSGSVFEMRSIGTRVQRR